MDNEELRRLRVQHIMDQQQATWDEARQLVQAEFDFPYYGAGETTDRLTDSQAFVLLNHYHDAPLSEWVVEETFPEQTIQAHAAGLEHAAYPPMPFLMNWMGEDGVVIKTTLTLQLAMFAAGWRARGQVETSRIGDRDLTKRCVENMLGVAQFMLKERVDELDNSALSDYQRLAGACGVFLRALEMTPASWFSDEEIADDGGAADQDTTSPRH